MADFDRAQHQARATNLGLSMGRGRPRCGAQRAPARPLLRDPLRLFHRFILKIVIFYRTQIEFDCETTLQFTLITFRYYESLNISETEIIKKTTSENAKKKQKEYNKNAFVRTLQRRNCSTCFFPSN